MEYTYTSDQSGNPWTVRLYLRSSTVLMNYSEHAVTIRIVRADGLPMIAHAMGPWQSWKPAWYCPPDEWFTMYMSMPLDIFPTISETLPQQPAVA